MRTAGKVLAEKRNSLGLTLEQVERGTKIRKKVIQALEASQWSTLPSPTFVKGFIRNYGRFLGLETGELLALYRREVDEKKFPATHHQLIPTLPNRFRFRPSFWVITTVIVVVFSFFGYLYNEFKSFVAPPFLQVIEPGDNIRINTNQISIVGSTDSEAILKVNGQKVDLSPGGTFSVAINLPEGKSAVTVTSENRFGGISKVNRDITVEKSDSQAPQASSSATTLDITIRIGPNPALLNIETDTGEKFDGVLLPGVTRGFKGNKLVKIKTSNAGSTQIVRGDRTETLGKEGESREVEIKP